MLKGFKEFILRGNVVDLAVGIVIGAAFTLVVTALVENVINPLVGLIFDTSSLNDSLTLTIGDAHLKFGVFVAALIQFVIVAAVVYFAVVVPVNKLMLAAAKRRKAGEDAAEDAAPTELDVLSEIRDLLANEQPSGAGRHSGAPADGQ